MESKPNIQLEDAQRAIGAGLRKSQEIEIPMSLAVVDASGNLVALARMDGASLLSLDVAIRKAYTSAIAGYPTGAFFDAVKEDPPLLAGLAHRPDLALFGGGIPLTGAGGVIAAVGVSGGHYTDDHGVAEAMVKAMQP